MSDEEYRVSDEEYRRLRMLCQGMEEITVPQENNLTVDDFNELKRRAILVLDILGAAPQAGESRE